MSGSPDYWNELCNFAHVVFADPESFGAAIERHERIHEQREAEAVVIGAILRKMDTAGWSGLTERETEIMRAYSVGATLPL